MTEKKIKSYNLQASIPGILRLIGIGGAILAVIGVGIGFYIASTRQEFRGKDFPAELSENVVGIVNGYERKETENGVLKYFVKAETAKTFDDNHQELDSVILHIYKDGKSDVFDRVSANRAVYIPVADSKEFTIYFAGDVDIRTHDKLEVKTDQLNYRSLTEIANAEESVTFKRFNISGSSYGAVVDVGKKTLELQKDVEILAEGAGEAETAELKVKRAFLKSGNAFVDSDSETIKLSRNVAINIIPDSGGGVENPTDINSLEALVFLKDKEIRRIELDRDVLVKQNPTSQKPDWFRTRAQKAVALIDKSVQHLSLFDDVVIETNRGRGETIKAVSDNAVYTKDGEVFELNDSVEINTVRDSSPMRANGARAVYKQTRGEILLSGGAQISRGGELIKADSIEAKLDQTNQLKFAKATQNAYLKQIESDRTSEIYADVLTANFRAKQTVSSAKARGATRIVVSPGNKSEYSKFRLSTPNGLDAGFNADGSVSEVNTFGRTTLNLDAGSERASATDRTVTADTIKTVFRPSGNELLRAHAIGNAELVVVPKSAQAGEYKTAVNSPRFDCEFFPGNNARTCTSTRRSKAVRTALNGKSETQVLEADSLVSEFEKNSRDISVFRSSGRSRFSQGDKNGSAETISYSPIDSMVRMRGGEPTVWDSNARAKANMIDWNTKTEQSVLVGGVSTTYYSQKRSGGATPFSESGSPVFLTSNSARFDQKARTAVYLGNARAWQEKNYVRGEKLFIEEAAGRFFAEGNVQSVLYDAKRTVGANKSSSPVFVSAGTMLFQREVNKIRYEKKVDIRQGPDRIVANAADVYLTSDNDLSKTVASGNVVITQPKRRATGDFAQYDAIAETVLLKGDPATFTDSESGSTTGKVVNVDLKNKKAVNSGSSSPTDSGRIRSVYNVKGSRLN